MQSFQSDFKRFEMLSAQVLGVSSDPEETHREFSKKLDLSFPLVSDDGNIRRLYGGGRITYLIDQAGVVRFIMKGMPDNEELLREINNLQSYR